MSKRLRIAVVGAGHMGKYHAQVLAERDDVELVAVCDVDEHRAGEVALKCGARAETDVGRIAGELDAAVVAAATSAHRRVAVPLMERGVAVLVEKPLAGTAREAREIVAAAHRTGAVAQVGHILRFDPVTRAVADLPLKPAYIDVSWVAPFTARSADVGVVMDVLIHGLDLVLHWVGEMPVQVDSFGGVIVGPHEDLVNVRLAFSGGCVANLTASRFSRSRERLVRVFTDRAYLRLDYASCKVEKVTPKPGLVERVRKGGPPTGGMEDCVRVEELPVGTEPDALRAQLGAFLAAARGERPVAVPLEEGARAVEVAEQVIEGIRGRRSE